MNTLAEKIKIINFNRDMPGLDPGSNRIIDDKYFQVKFITFIVIEIKIVLQA